MRREQEVRSSLTLQVLLYFNRYFVPIFFLLNVLLFIYKSYHFPYPESIAEVEAAFVAAYILIEMGRLMTGSRGNKTEQVGPMVWSILMAVPIIILHVYYFAFQTYVVRLDRILNGIGLGFVCLELLFSLLATLTFYRHSKL